MKKEGGVVGESKIVEQIKVECQGLLDCYSGEDDICSAMKLGGFRICIKIDPESKIYEPVDFGFFTAGVRLENVCGDEDYFWVELRAFDKEPTGEDLTRVVFRQLRKAKTMLHSALKSLEFLEEIETEVI